MVDATERYAAELIPSDYSSWRYCIEVKCCQELTPRVSSGADRHTK